MSSDSSQIFDAALVLPDGERADLAFRLLQSLKPPGVLSDHDLDFEVEIERRIAALDAGASSATDWDTVSERLRKALDDRKPS